MKKTLMEEFDVKVKSEEVTVISDYKIFDDKVLLDKLRSEIIENIIDKKMPDEDTLDSLFTAYAASFRSQQTVSAISGAPVSAYWVGSAEPLGKVFGAGPLTALHQTAALWKKDGGAYWFSSSRSKYFSTLLTLPLFLRKVNENKPLQIPKMNGWICAFCHGHLFPSGGISCLDGLFPELSSEKETHTEWCGAY